MKTAMKWILGIFLLMVSVSGQTHWAAYTERPVMEPSPGEWDATGVFADYVMMYEDTLRMWYDAMPTHGIGYAWSLDGINWTKFAGNPVITSGPEIWDNSMIYPGGVVVVDQEFVMVYTSWSSIEQVWQVGMATAPHSWGPWTKLEENPVLTSTDFGDDPVYAVQSFGLEFEDQQYQLYYHWRSENGMSGHICFATSDSLIDWDLNYPELITACGPAAIFEGDLDFGRSIVRNGDTQYLFYEGVGTGPGPYGLAVSVDGGDFEHSPWNPVLDEYPGNYWFTQEWNYPKVIFDPMTNLFRLWFTSYIDGSNEIGTGYATSLLGYRGLDTLDLESAFIRVRYEGDPGITLFAKFNSDGVADSVQLLDDGLHQDLMAGDSIYGCPLPDGEYTISIAGYMGSDLIIEYNEVESLVVVHVDETLAVPSSLRLEQNYPNPFNPSTTISYDLPFSSDVTLTVYDITGRTITNLEDSHQPAGTYSIQWTGNNDFGNPVSTGVYFCRLEAGDYTKTIKMVYLK